MELKKWYTLVVCKDMKMCRRALDQMVEEVRGLPQFKIAKMGLWLEYVDDIDGQDILAHVSFISRNSIEQVRGKLCHEYYWVCDMLGDRYRPFIDQLSVAKHRTLKQEDNSLAEAIVDSFVLDVTGGKIG